ncbi:MAG: DUF4831 family protein [Bacteroidota bacterium]
MRFIRSYILAGAIMFLFPLFISAQINVNRIDESFNTVEQEGLIYALPQTLIQVNVTVEQKELLAGPLRDYAEEYLGITNIVSRNGFEYSIKDIRLSSISEPDPAQYYFISPGEKSSKEAWQTMLNLNGKGVITSIRSSNANKADQTSALSRSMSADELMQMFIKYADLNLYPKVDTIIRRIDLDTITIEDYTFHTSMTEKPLELKAEEIADRIKKIREGRYNLLTGYHEINYSAAALKFMNEELLRMESAYLRLFTGATVKRYLSYTFIYLPTIESAGNKLPLFMLSESEGISESGGGEEVSIEITLSGNTSGMDSSNGGLAKGIYYRLPEEAGVRIYYRDQVVAELRTPVSQFGRLGVLPANTTDVEFDEQTGGLRKVQLKVE